MTSRPAPILLFSLLVFTFLSAPVSASAQSQTQLPLLVGVLDFEANDVRSSEVVSITDRLRIYLNRSQVFNVLERRQMEGILREQGFQLSGACDTDECVVQAGKILGARKMVAGSVSKVGNVYSIQVRIVDVTTGRIEQTAFADSRGDISTVLQEGTLQVALQLIQAVRVSLGLPPSEDLLGEEAQLRGGTGPLRYPNGWHFRWHAGIGPFQIATGDDYKADLGGLGVLQEMAFGLTLSDRLSLQMVFSAVASLGEVQQDYGDRIASAALDTTMTQFGGMVGLTYYLVPHSWYVSLMLGAASWSLQTDYVPIDEATSESTPGFTIASGAMDYGLEFILGKEYWISHRIGFGMALRGMRFTKSSSYGAQVTFIWDF
jgi:TolB-like protein